MAEPTLQQVLGANATQDATTITIVKADLTGLTASANNTAESLVTGIILKASGYLNSTNQATNTDIQITIEDSNFPQVVTRNNTQYRQTTYNVNFQSADNYTLDPDNF
ncbi:MAG: hypothetical protein RMZ69_23835 [Nostoc sp. ChiQUE01a]|nr:hypothetical protein [Nostoc sp. DcaGUA01]MDZ8083434.1 hypothetical protein [Nostoc sp. DcaGUA01]MDZ8240142.1 hypothetical protein [Nostoc sp. ChiQUE01a]